MGRPIDKNFIGDPERTGLQINLTTATFADGGTVTGPYIVRQRSNLQYEVSNSAGTKSEVLTLFDATGSAPPGFAALRVLPATGGSEYVRSLHGNTVKTFQGNIYSWVHQLEGKTATEQNQADFEPAMS